VLSLINDLLNFLYQKVIWNLVTSPCLNSNFLKLLTPISSYLPILVPSICTFQNWSFNLYATWLCFPNSSASKSTAEFRSVFNMGTQPSLCLRCCSYKWWKMAQF